MLSQKIDFVFNCTFQKEINNIPRLSFSSACEEIIINNPANQYVKESLRAKYIGQ